MERAQALLAEAGVERSTWQGMAPLTPTGGLGSAAEVMFRAPQSLQAERLAVKALRKEHMAGKPAWLDAKRDRAETAPVRIVHRLHQALSDVARTASGHQGSAAPEVVKDVGGRSVRVRGVRVAHISRLRVRWTPAAAAHFAEEERDAAASFAEAT